MLEARSPLSASPSFEVEGLTLREEADFTLTQYAGTPRIMKRELEVEALFGTAEKHGGRTFLRTGENQIWVLGKPLEAQGCYATPLSSSRSCIAIQGPKARALLVACAPIDFSTGAFTTHHYAMTGIHHTPVLIHCIGPDSFHLYAMRSFALTVWEWLVDAAKVL